ncbi:unnamed protein product [Ectocarpus sp. CCAP 1310/34]|nr:unnamed protein product [Ectocarpus sp. CCAP 1310/34]
MRASTQTFIFYAYAHTLRTPRKTHGDIHGYLDWAFDCNTDVANFSAEHPEYSHGLLAFALQILTFKFTACNSLTPHDNVCDVSYERGQTEPCGCTCLMDASSIPEEQVCGYMQPFMQAAMPYFRGYLYITHDEEAKFPYGFIQDDHRVSDEHAVFLMRTLVKIGCEPGAVGIMSTAASPVNPMFWVLHPLFEKAMHILLLSPKYDDYTMEWVDGECKGSGYTEELTITGEAHTAEDSYVLLAEHKVVHDRSSQHGDEKRIPSRLNSRLRRVTRDEGQRLHARELAIGLGPGEDFLTNQQLLELMYPSNPALPQIYNNLPRWGGTDTELV